MVLASLRAGITTETDSGQFETEPLGPADLATR